MTKRMALLGAVVLGLVLTASAVAVSMHGGSGDDHATRNVAPSPPARQRMVVLNPASGTVIGQSSTRTRHVVILDPSNGQVISSVGWLAP